jgi:hypothetical protein
MSREMKWLRFLDLGAYLTLAAVACTHWHNDLHHWIGAAISVPSFFLWMLARHQLGDSFAVRAEAKKLVTHGLYSESAIRFTSSEDSHFSENSWLWAGTSGQQSSCS